MDARREQAEKLLTATLKREGRTMTKKEFDEAIDYITRQADEKGRERG